jgi:hypothetical protein
MMMTRFKGRSAGWLGLAALATVVAACSAPATTASSVTGATTTPLPPYLPGWEVYDTVDDASVDLPTGELTPFSLAQSLLQEPETWECFRVSQVRVEALDEGKMAVLATQVGLCDDSVGAIEQRIDLAPTPTGWMLDQVGQRFGCARTEFFWAEPGTLCP